MFPRLLTSDIMAVYIYYIKITYILILLFSKYDLLLHIYVSISVRQMHL